MNLPGYDEALRLGYTLYSYNGDRTKATYAKGSVFLDVFNPDGDPVAVARLSAMIGLVELRVDQFAFPNKNFPIFERAIRTALDTCEETGQWVGLPRIEVTDGFPVTVDTPPALRKVTAELIAAADDGGWHSTTDCRVEGRATTCRLCLAIKRAREEVNCE